MLNGNSNWSAGGSGGLIWRSPENHALENVLGFGGSADTTAGVGRVYDLMTGLYFSLKTLW